jgi:hypothetical protein
MSLDYMDYPTFTPVEGRGLIPTIRLPKDYKELISGFYRQGRKEIIEEFVDQVRNLSELDIMLQWDNCLGLTNISIGIHGGLDLSDDPGVPVFQEHNLGGTSCLEVAAIAQEYVAELLKSR